MSSWTVAAASATNGQAPLWQTVVALAVAVAVVLVGVFLIVRRQSDATDRRLETLRDEHAARIAELEAQVTSRLEESRGESTRHSGELGRHLATEVGAVRADSAQWFRELDQTLAARLDDLRSDLSVRVGKLENNVTGRLEELRADATARLERLEEQLAGRQDAGEVAARDITNVAKSTDAVMSALARLDGRVERITERMDRVVEQQAEAARDVATQGSQLRDTLDRQLASVTTAFAALGDRVARWEDRGRGPAV